MMGNYGWIFHLLDHKTYPIGEAFDFGYLMKAYGIVYTHICCALESVTLNYQKPVGTSIYFIFLTEK